MTLKVGDRCRYRDGGRELRLAAILPPDLHGQDAVITTTTGAHILYKLCDLVKIEMRFEVGKKYIKPSDFTGHYEVLDIRGDSAIGWFHSYLDNNDKVWAVRLANRGDYTEYIVPNYAHTVGPGLYKETSIY